MIFFKTFFRVKTAVCARYRILFNETENLRMENSAKKLIIKHKLEKFHISQLTNVDIRMFGILQTLEHFCNDVLRIAGCEMFLRQPQVSIRDIIFFQ